MKGERINRTPARHSRRTMDTDIRRATSSIENEDKKLSIAPRQLFAGSREIDGEEALKVARVLSAQVKGMSTTGAHTFYRQILERRLAQGPLPKELERFGSTGAEIANHIANHLSGMDLLDEKLTDEERDVQMDERKEFAHKLLTSHGLDEEIKKPNKLLQNQAILGVHGAGVHTMFRSVPRYLSTSAKGFGLGLIEGVLDKVTFGKVRKARNLGAYDIGQGLISELIRTKAINKIPLPITQADMIEEPAEEKEVKEKVTPPPLPNKDLDYVKPGVHEKIYHLAGKLQQVQDAMNDDVEDANEPEVEPELRVDPELITAYKKGLGIDDHSKLIHPEGVHPTSQEEKASRDELGDLAEHHLTHFINELKSRNVTNDAIKDILNGAFTARTNRNGRDRNINYSNFMLKTAENLRRRGHTDIADEIEAGHRVYYPIHAASGLPNEFSDQAFKLITRKVNPNLPIFQSNNNKIKGSTRVSSLFVNNNVTPHLGVIINSLQENQQRLTPLQRTTLGVYHLMHTAKLGATAAAGNQEEHILQLVKKSLTPPAKAIPDVKYRDTGT